MKNVLIKKGQNVIYDNGEVLGEFFTSKKVDEHINFLLNTLSFSSSLSELKENTSIIWKLSRYTTSFFKLNISDEIYKNVSVNSILSEENPENSVIKNSLSRVKEERFLSEIEYEIKSIMDLYENKKLDIKTPSDLNEYLNEKINSSAKKAKELILEYINALESNKLLSSSVNSRLGEMKKNIDNTQKETFNIIEKITAPILEEKKELTKHRVVIKFNEIFKGKNSIISSYQFNHLITTFFKVADSKPKKEVSKLNLSKISSPKTAKKILFGEDNYSGLDLSQADCLALFSIMNEDDSLMSELFKVNMENSPIFYFIDLIDVWGLYLGKNNSYSRYSNKESVFYKILTENLLSSLVEKYPNTNLLIDEKTILLLLKENVKIDESQAASLLMKVISSPDDLLGFNDPKMARLQALGEIKKVFIKSSFDHDSAKRFYEIASSSSAPHEFSFMAERLYPHYNRWAEMMTLDKIMLDKLYFSSSLFLSLILRAVNEENYAFIDKIISLEHHFTNSSNDAKFLSESIMTHPMVIKNSSLVKKLYPLMVENLSFSTLSTSKKGYSYGSKRYYESDSSGYPLGSEEFSKLPENLSSFVKDSYGSINDKENLKDHLKDLRKKQGSLYSHNFKEKGIDFPLEIDQTVFSKALKMLQSLDLSPEELKEEAWEVFDYRDPYFVQWLENSNGGQLSEDDLERFFRKHQRERDPEALPGIWKKYIIYFMEKHPRSPTMNTLDNLKIYQDKKGDKTDPEFFSELLVNLASRYQGTAHRSKNAMEKIIKIAAKSPLLSSAIIEKQINLLPTQAIFAAKTLSLSALLSEKNLAYFRKIVAQNKDNKIELEEIIQSRLPDAKKDGSRLEKLTDNDKETLKDLIHGSKEDYKKMHSLSKDFMQDLNTLDFSMLEIFINKIKEYQMIGPFTSFLISQAKRSGEKTKNLVATIIYFINGEKLAENIFSLLDHDNVSFIKALFSMQKKESFSLAETLSFLLVHNMSLGEVFESITKEEASEFSLLVLIEELNASEKSYEIEKSMRYLKSKDLYSFLTLMIEKNVDLKLYSENVLEYLTSHSKYLEDDAATDMESCKSLWRQFIAGEKNLELKSSNVVSIDFKKKR